MAVLLGAIKRKSINYNFYKKASKEYLLGEIAHTERSANQFRKIGDSQEAKDREDHAKMLWKIYYSKK
jgi:hypothetical protein